MGEVTEKAATKLRLADHIFIEELRRAGWYEKTSQAFAVYLPVRSVGVTGDGRRYEPVIALRAVQTVDFMTAHWAQLPCELLDLCSRRIVNEGPGVSRVVYAVSGKPPATIKWDGCRLSRRISNTVKRRIVGIHRGSEEALDVSFKTIPEACSRTAA